MKARELRAQRAGGLKKANARVGKSEEEERDFTPEEQAEYDGYLSQADELEKRAVRLGKYGGMANGLGGASRSRAPAPPCSGGRSWRRTPPRTFTLRSWTTWVLWRGSCGEACTASSCCWRTP